MHNRDHKVFGQRSTHHIYNRGVGKMDIFCSDKDFVSFLYRLQENLFPEKVPQSRRLPSPGGYTRKLLPSKCFTLLSYSLMPNHFHLLIRQDADLAISKLMLKLCGGYSKYFNGENDRVGSLFQDQFKSVLIESDEQLLWTSAYIHNNPRTAGLVAELKDYKWSSYLDFIGLRQGTLCDKNLILGMCGNDERAYKKFVEDSFDKIKERKDLEHLFLDN